MKFKTKILVGFFFVFVLCCRRTNVIPVPAIISFTPSSDTVGGEVFITGVNFSSQPSEDLVSINGVAANVVQASSTSLTIMVPPGANSDYINLVVDGQKAESDKIFNVIPTAGSPTITKVSPDTSMIGGTVYITGTNLGTTTNGDSVWFGGVLATLTGVSPTQITVIVPVKALNGKIKVSVNKKIATTSSDFIVPAPTISGFDPPSDTIGASITITGTNFYFDRDYDSVKFNSLNAVISNATNTTLTVTVPSNAVSGIISVIVGAQTVLSSQPFIIPVPVITSFQNTRDTIGATVTISGSNFHSNASRDTVRFDGVEANVISASPNLLTVQVPDGTNSGPVTLKVNGQTATASADFTVIGVSTLAGNRYSGNINGTGPNASFGNLSGIGTDALGNVYVSDYKYGLIKKIDSLGQVTTLAGSGQIGSTDGAGDTASFNWIFQLAVGPNGNVYTTEPTTNKIRKISPSGFVSTLANTENPRGIAVDRLGNVFFTGFNNTINKITPGGSVSVIAGGNPDGGYVDGDVSVAQFNSPGSLAVDDNDNLYVGDAGNYLIRKITASGQVSTVAGTGQQGLSIDGVGLQASFYSIKSLALDHQGNLYVLDFNEIRKITPAGLVSTFSGSLNGGFQEGGLLSALYFGPDAIVVDGNGNLYVCDSGNNRVRKITPF